MRSDFHYHVLPYSSLSLPRPDFVYSFFRCLPNLCVRFFYVTTYQRMLIYIKAK